MALMERLQEVQTSVVALLMKSVAMLAVTEMKLAVVVAVER